MKRQNYILKEHLLPSIFALWFTFGSSIIFR